LRLDDEIKQGSVQFFQASTDLWRERIREVQAYTGELLTRPLNLREDEFLEVDAEKRAYPRDRRALKELWRKIIKHQTLVVYLNLLLAETEQGTAAEQWAAVQQQPFRPELEQQAREKVEKDLNLIFNRLLREKTEDRFAAYLSALAQSFDPHTNYLAPKAQEDFEIEMTGTLEGIGATLQSDGEYVRVVSIEPGGPSWRQGQLKAGDLIMKVAQGEEEPVDLANMPLDEAVRLIRGPKGTEVRLTVKKPDGQIVVISIIRDVVVFEAKFAQSMVIEHPTTGVKIGYITLPSFYHDYSNAQGRTSAGDVRKELEKLKKEGVDGVILDLRNNGGGALVDAVETAGLFIDSGPIVQVKDKKGKIRVYQDPDPTMVYAGPLVVMINSLSASASEIVAAALQDYGRAVIVGSSSSYGKGTVQEMLDLDYLLDYFYPRAGAYKPMGALKLTIEKFYRINGGSTQYKGVTSDVVLPDPYAYLEISEQTLEYALPWDQVKPLNYQKWTEPLWELQELKTRSARRIAANPNFAAVQRYIEQVKAEKEQSLVSLQL
ncbi:MAG: carboxy terminal-processing peptidase, partial [Firmicutes bacterium]|nr:carboxy terminal-processing peptidase [Bacillota bacterium]